MKSVLLFLILIFSTLNAYPVGFHIPAEIQEGTFTGDYNFNGNVGVNGDIIVNGGNLNMSNNKISDIQSISSDGSRSLPYIELHSTSSGDNWNDQGAYISIGESGALGSASMHMTYRGDGYGFIGSGAVSNAIPGASYLRFDYNSDNIYTQDNLDVDAQIKFNSAYADGYLNMNNNNINNINLLHFPNDRNFNPNPSGDYGSVQVNGNGKNGWEGYSIDGRYVFMSSDINNTGIYNDVDNHWVIRYSRDSALNFYEPDDGIAAMTIGITGEVNMHGNRIENVGTPNSNDDVATKGYVDSKAGGSSDFYYHKLQLPGGGWHLCYINNNGLLFSNSPANGDTRGATDYFYGLSLRSSQIVYIGKDDWTSYCPSGWSFFAKDESTAINCVGNRYNNGWICKKNSVSSQLMSLSS